MIKSWLSKYKRNLQKKAVVLMYHRIANVQTDPWQLAVSPANFEQQLKVLQSKQFNVLPVPELLIRLKDKSLSGNEVCITFDDGYSDNCTAAKPLLEKYQKPATLFICTHYINQDQQFWWDELERILLHSSHLPDGLSLNIDSKRYNLRLLTDNHLTDEALQHHMSWKWPQQPPTRRCELYLQIWELLKPLPFAQIIDVLQQIRTWSAFSDLDAKESFPVKMKQLEEIAKNSLFTIGAHTTTHPGLSYHCRQTQEEAIVGSKRYLESHLAVKVNALAYPYGNYNDLTLKIAEEQKFEAAFTTNETVVNEFSSCYQLGRFQVKNWDGETFEKKLNNFRQID